MAIGSEDFGTSLPDASSSTRDEDDFLRFCHRFPIKMNLCKLSRQNESSVSPTGFVIHGIGEARLFGKIQIQDQDQVQVQVQVQVQQIHPCHPCQIRNPLIINNL